MTKQNRQQKRFQQLTRPWRDRLLGVALRQANNAPSAEGWVQETLLRAWRDMNTLSDDVAVYAWLLKILDHVIADDTRRNARRHKIAPVVSADDAFFQAQPSAAPGPFEQTVTQQTEAQINNAIKALPDEFSAVILLRDIEGLSYTDIAQILSLPQGTVMSRLSRGRRLLASIIIKQEMSVNQPSTHSTTARCKT